MWASASRQALSRALKRCREAADALHVISAGGLRPPLNFNVSSYKSVLMTIYEQPNGPPEKYPCDINDELWVLSNFFFDAAVELGVDQYQLEELVLNKSASGGVVNDPKGTAYRISLLGAAVQRAETMHRHCRGFPDMGLTVR